MNRNTGYDQGLTSCGRKMAQIWSQHCYWGEVKSKSTLFAQRQPTLNTCFNINDIPVFILCLITVYGPLGKAYKECKAKVQHKLFIASSNVTCDTATSYNFAASLLAVDNLSPSFFHSWTVLNQVLQRTTLKWLQFKAGTKCILL